MPDDVPIEPPLPPRRCCGCGYVLEHLTPAGVCPECGRAYDFADPRTFTDKPPFAARDFWMPGLLTAFGFGSILYLVLVPYFGFGWSTTFAIPLASGVLLGYSVRVGPFVSITLAIVLSLAILATLMAANITGGLCVLVLFLVTLGPLLAGMVVGTLLGMSLGVMTRKGLKRSSFSQRSHLPLLLAGGVVLLTFLEGRHRGMAVVSTSTVAVVNATPEQAWRAIQFYEQVRHRPPLLLWVSPSLRPQYTTGPSEHVGDRKVCVYAKGRLVKEITEVEPGKRLAFRVVEQTDIENDGVRLVDGSFDLEPTADGRGTVVTLTTRYEPKLAPRFAYLPAENWAVHTLHGHVLRGMKEDAESHAP